MQRCRSGSCASWRCTEDCRLSTLERPIHSGEAGAGNLDFIVDDIDETPVVLEAEGASPSAIRRGNPHDSFIASDPEGNKLVVNSNHAIGVV